MSTEISVGDILLCEIKSTGQCGLLHVDQGKIWVEFIRFGDRPSVNAAEAIHLHTSKGWIVSLHNNIDVSSTIPFWRRGEVGTIYRQKIVSNLAVAGESAWLDSDLARTASIKLSVKCDFLWPSDLLAELSEISVDNQPDSEMLRVAVPDGAISLKFSVRSDSIRAKWTPEEPYLTFEFNQGTTPFECLQQIWYLEGLFALVSWRPDICAADIFIRKVGAEERSYSHRILPRHRDVDVEVNEAQDVDLTLLSAGSTEERDNLQSVISAWFENKERWHEVTGLMRAAASRLTRVTAERTLDACRWHEALERAHGEVGGPPNGMEKVIAAAVDQAERESLHKYVDWIKSSLKNIRSEPRQARLSTVAAQVNDNLNQDMFDDASLAMLSGAYRTRHTTGHGALGRQSSDGVRRLWGDTLAMEALCAARMLSELPTSERNAHLLSMHPLFKAFIELRNERREDAAT